MGEFLSYSILSGLLMLAMYMAYRLFLARDNQHGFNRAVLLSIYLVSFMASPFIFSLDTLNVSTNPQAFTLEGIEVVETEGAVLSKPIWGTVLIWLFLAGMAAVTIKTIITWIRLTNVIRKGEKIRHAGYTLVVTDDERFAPFSWMRYVVISRSDYDNNSSAIATHELKHVACRHWIDLLIAQIICIINWFNPVAWLMRDELMLVHEYQADMAVIDSGHDTQEYQMLLIKKAVGARFPSLANSLNHSKLKKRITMMYKSKSGNARRMRSIALLPAALLAAAVVNIPAVASVIDNAQSCSLTSAESAGKVSDITEKKQTRTTTVTVSKNKEAEKVVVVNAGTIKKDTIKQAQKVTTVNVEDIDGEIMINGKKASKEELKNINPQSVENIAISKDGQMSITLKKDADTNNAPASKNIKKVVVVGASTMKKEDTGKTSERKVILDGSETELVIYANDKKITNEQLRKIKPEDIKSILVEKEKDVMRVTLKEGVEVPE